MPRGRPANYNRRYTVEECGKLSIQVQSCSQPGTNHGTAPGKAFTWSGVPYPLRFPDGRQAAFVCGPFALQDNEGSVEFLYTIDGIAYQETLRFWAVPQKLGGVRWWMRCPQLRRNQTPCDRRVSKLWIPPNSVRFGCRNCHRLEYRSSRPSQQFRALCDSISRQMGHTPECAKEWVRHVAGDRPTPPVCSECQRLPPDFVALDPLTSRALEDWKAQRKRERGRKRRSKLRRRDAKRDVCT